MLGMRNYGFVILHSQHFHLYALFCLSIPRIFLIMIKVAIIGAGAAGCFCAVNLKRMMPEAYITVYESGKKPLAKVAVTGGGRCNLTNSFRQVRSIKSVYPRGEKLMKRMLKAFSHEDTMSWFENEGVRLVVQDDECVFPASQNAMEIVGTLTALMRSQGVTLRLSTRVSSIAPVEEGGYMVDGEHYDAVVVTTGGSPRLGGLAFLDALHLDIVPPVPSLFTFCVADEALRQLMGTVVNGVSVKLTGTKHAADGPLLITHWGLSGPAILRLSSYGARLLAEKEYKMDVSVNWFGDCRECEVLDQLRSFAEHNPQKQLSSIYPEQFVQRHWLYLLSKAGLPHDKRWQETGPKQMTRLASLLTNDIYHIEGKGAYKEEFVTCGGVSLAEIDPSAMECRKHPQLYFAGEVLDVDAVTGGFNLQAAWSMGYACAKSISSSMR